MTTTEQRITELEARIDALRDQQIDLREQVTKAQVELWQGRIEDLELQARLGTMDAADKVAPLRDELRDQWLDVKAQLARSKATAAEVIDAVRDTLEKAIADLREAIVEARTQDRDAD